MSGIVQRAFTSPQELRQIPGEAGHVAVVAPPGGGLKFFRWVGTSTASDDGAVTIAVTTHTGAGRWVWDDEAAISDAGGIITATGVSGALQEHRSAIDAVEASIAGGPVVFKRAVTITHAELTNAVNGAADTINIGAVLPTNADVIGWSVRDVTGFSGGSVSECVMDIGGTDPDALCDGLELITDAPTAAEIVAAYGVLFQGGSFSAQQLTATFTPDAGNPLADLTAGSVTIVVYFTVQA